MGEGKAMKKKMTNRKIRTEMIERFFGVFFESQPLFATDSRG
jgi:hypothetical protein